MRFSEAWLREWVNPDISTDELVEQLTMAGLEVDSVTTAAPAFTGVVVGKVLSKQQHPDADKLSVCSVDIGTDEPSQIVCGAKNVAADMKVPVATVGACLPGDFKIKKAKLRGVESLGMICSASELGLADSSDGIMPLPGDAPIGEDFRDYLSLDDTLIEVDLTPDRGDCLSIAGVARDVAVIYKIPLVSPNIQPVTNCIDNKISLELKAKTECPRYTCRVIRGINTSAETPQWMTEKLRRGGIRPISPVVDVTNYVMLELGQPMHGFDLANIDGGITVRIAHPDEKMTLLDGTEIELKEGSLLIADDSKPLALAGIMGGEASGVTDQTKDILLESAFFMPIAIAGKARAYGLHTDSSHRFERGVDYELQLTALERATSLLLEIVGGEAGKVVESVSEQHLPRTPVICLRRAQVPRILGVEVDDEQIEDILTRLGMTLVLVDEGWDVVAPSARFDVTIEADLLEEIGRIYGYDNIPENLSSAPVSIKSTEEATFRLDKAKQLLVDRGYQEVITYSFISPEMADLMTPNDVKIELANPISSDMSVMRSSLWPGLLSTLQYNLARQQDRIRLFESGLSFVQDDEIVQQPMLAGLIYGDIQPEQWGDTARKVDFYDLKADVEAILGQVSELSGFQFESGEDTALHPGQTAIIIKSGVEIGRIGLLHPALQAKLGISGNVILFQLRLRDLAEGEIPAFVPLSKFPSIRRDIALAVDYGMPYSKVLACARAAAVKIVRDIRIFDVYTGKNVDSGVKSFALSLILQETSHTLTDQEVEKATAGVVTALEQELSVKLRD